MHSTLNEELLARKQTELIEDCAKLCHNAIRSYCDMHNRASFPAWEDADEWQKASAISGVKYKLDNMSATPKDQHEQWKKEKIADGWNYGKVKDALKKEHPCIVDYSELPDYEKGKDVIFACIVEGYFTK